MKSVTSWLIIGQMAISTTNELRSCAFLSLERRVVSRISPLTTPPSLLPSAGARAARSHARPLRHVLRHPRTRPTTPKLSSASTDIDDALSPPINKRPTPEQSKFSLSTAVFCAGLAFDAYTEPPPDSSRWERGSSGLNVAFLSPTYTRNLYKGIIEVTPLRASDLPDEDDAAESLITGGGVDASLLVSVVEGAWKEDVTKLEKEQFHNGVLDLAGCAHVGRSATAWSNVDERKAKRNKAKGGSGAYHIKSSWGRGGQAVWENDPPFYLYVQEPKDARLVFTLFDEDVVGGGQPIGSAHRKLVDLLPSAKTDDAVSMLKGKVLDDLKNSGQLSQAIVTKIGADGTEETTVDYDIILKAINDAYGSGTTASIKMTSKPRKKDKGGQTSLGVVAGAMIAGPAGAAVGGILASMYEGEVRGKVEVGLKFTPIPQTDWKLKKRDNYEVKGGLPGVDWGRLYENHVTRALGNKSKYAPDETANDFPKIDPRLAGSDLEFCCFVTHDLTGCSCAIYRSLERRLICVSFRGTCTPIDLVTDVSIAQSAWVEGEDVENPKTVKVHSGFRKSLNSISRRLKELMLAAVAPGEDLSDYNVLVTGHSLGGALATCFVMDIAEYGMDAGRGLPQLDPSDAWWNSISSMFAGKKLNNFSPPPPPRPKSLRMYNFGSPRVGNDAFCKKFDAMIGNGIDEAYRIVNDRDVVARLPRTVNALAFGNVGYDHCGPTVLITEIVNQISKHDERDSKTVDTFFKPKEMLWIEGESDDGDCPVRDGKALGDPLGSGSLLGDLANALREENVIPDPDPKDTSNFSLSKLGNIAGRVTGRLQKLTPEDITSMVGINKQFTQRELNFLQSIFSGEGLSHHMEDKYYQGMGMCCGYAAVVGQELMPLEELEKMDVAEIEEAIGRLSLQEE